jgi:hypothetical protein
VSTRALRKRVLRKKALRKKALRKRALRHRTEQQHTMVKNRTWPGSSELDSSGPGMPVRCMTTALGSSELLGKSFLRTDHIQSSHLGIAGKSKLKSEKIYECQEI